MTKGFWSSQWWCSKHFRVLPNTLGSASSSHQCKSSKSNMDALADSLEATSSDKERQAIIKGITKEDIISPLHNTIKSSKDNQNSLPCHPKKTRRNFVQPQGFRSFQADWPFGEADACVGLPESGVVPNAISCKRLGIFGRWRVHPVGWNQNHTNGAILNIYTTCLSSIRVFESVWGYNKHIAMQVEEYSFKFQLRLLAANMSELIDPHTPPGTKASHHRKTWRHCSS